MQMQVGHARRPLVPSRDVLDLEQTSWGERTIAKVALAERRGGQMTEGRITPTGFGF
jgi:hypothetical protein